MPERDHQCYYCKLTDDKVEAGGVYHCPNVLCTGPGAGYWRSKLESYTEHADGKHTVDPMEALSKGYEHMLTLPADSPVRAAIRASGARWADDMSAQSILTP